MHELSMANSILNAVITNAKKNNAIEVTEIVVEIGKLALINPEQVRFMLDVLSEDSITKGAKFIIEEIPIEIKCKECGYNGITDENNFDHYTPIVECPKCENKLVNVVNGKDCIIKNIVIEKPDDD